MSLITSPATRWSVTLSPQVSAVTTRTKHLAAGRSAEGRLQGKNDHEFDQFK